MKIAYLVECNVYKTSGVLLKIDSQIQSWREQGHEVMPLFISPNGAPGRSSAIEGATVVSSKISELFHGPLRGYLNRVTSGSRCRKHIEDFSPDVIYYRLGVWYPGLLKTLRKAPLVIEVNSKNIGRDLNAPFWVRRIGAWLSEVLEYRVVRLARGVVAVTNELAFYYDNIGPSVCVVGNGYDLCSMQPRPLPNNERTQLVYVGSPPGSLHNESSLVELATGLPECDVHVVGSDRRFEGPSNLFFHSFMERDELVNFYRNMDVGIGAVAPKCNDLQEYSSLKVREYVANGLPVVVGHKDTDLHDCSFVLDIGQEENNVLKNLDNIRAFISVWQGREIDYSVVLSRIDFHEKEKKRIAFIESCLN